MVLWIEGVDGLSEMREIAPDAYAFRDVVVMVRGDGGRLSEVAYETPQSTRDAKRTIGALSSHDGDRCFFAIVRAAPRSWICC